ncbi:hypothetical protein A3SI_11639 [Nitritalea halalkaliphila LW7]|uniref:Uncharacterized protein n=1 Tax=Nitritalea halalkaliphila LW7 TaxID=1189621 RepID=I5C2F9_9BACT|nr:hypothetical protein [Nitritalea halalkaliphila]EIM76011.1 hypothetical protein A3SI_11639 [Nitritalea halalkaliphila LW7]
MLLAASLMACSPKETALTAPIETHTMQTEKKVVYQVFTRLFGNTGTAQKPGARQRKMASGSLRISRIRP